MTSCRVAVFLTSCLVAVTMSGAPMAQTPAKPTLEGYPAAGSPSTVTVLSAGAEPRTTLRYKIARDHKSQMLMTMAMNMGMSIEGIGELIPATDFPVMKMTADLSVNHVAANGDLTFDVTFTDLKVETQPGFDPAMASAMEQASGSIKGMKASATVTNRGVTSNTKFNLQGVTDQTLKQTLDSMSASLNNMSMPLPEGAVGVGARWEVRQALVTGFVSFQKILVELVSASGSTVNLKVSVEQTTPPQALAESPVPGATVSIEKMSGSGSGTVALGLESLVPTSELTTSNSSLMLIGVGGESQRATLNLKLKVNVAPVK